jgi:serine phosphatase RsbU (regulator of sigma subunit)
MKDEKRHLSVIHDLSSAIVSASRMEDVCKKILDKVASLLNVSKASIMKFDRGERVLKIVAAKGLPRDVVSEARVKTGQGVSGHVFRSKRPVLIKDIRSTKFKGRTSYATRSLMSAPVRSFFMKVQGKPIGVINVTDRKGKAGFTQGDMRLLTTIANQTAAYLHLCDLHEESARAEHLRRELEIARGIQQNLLPRHIPKSRHFDIHGTCIMAQRVGGDYFDVISGGARPLSIVVADVAGHSIGAAMMMSAFRSALKAEGPAAIFSPAIAAERLNAILYDDLSAAEQFISMVYMQFVSDDIVKYTTAGHYPPVILRGDGFINHSTEDMLLGVQRFAEYHERRIDLQKRDVIAAYTDGLVSAQNPAGRRFGSERLRGSLRRHRHLGAREMVDAVCDEVKAFAGKKALDDDVTLVVVKVL